MSKGNFRGNIRRGDLITLQRDEKIVWNVKKINSPIEIEIKKVEPWYQDLPELLGNLVLKFIEYYGFYIFFRWLIEGKPMF